VRPAVRSTTDGAQRTNSLGGNLFRTTVEGGVGLHTGPCPGNVHKVDTSLLEFPLLPFSFPDRVDIRSEAEKGETFRRLPLDLLRADGDSADERGSGQQDSGNERGGELHGEGLADDRGRLRKVRERRRRALYFIPSSGERRRSVTLQKQMLPSP